MNTKSSNFGSLNNKHSQGLEPEFCFYFDESTARVAIRNFVFTIL